VYFVSFHVCDFSYIYTYRFVPLVASNPGDATIHDVQHVSGPVATIGPLLFIYNTMLTSLTRNALILSGGRGLRLP